MKGKRQREQRSKRQREQNRIHRTLDTYVRGEGAYRVAMDQWTEVVR